MPKRPDSRSPFVVQGLVVLVALALLACAGGPPLAEPPGPTVPLAADEGFVVIQIDTDVGVEHIQLDHRDIVRDLQPGEHLWLIRMKAGRKRWTSVRLMPQSRTEDAIEPEAKGVLNEKEFEFDVQAGAINYPGELIVRFGVEDFGIGSGVSVRNRNHSAMAIRRLAKSHAKLLADHPLRYAGGSGDEFLQFYTQERDRMKASGGARAAAKEKR
jgi:hypothetical protein